MRLKVLVLLGFFLFSFVNVSGEYDTITNFNIDGCIFDFEDGKVSVAIGECSTKPLGEFYCDLDGYGWETTEPGLGCSMGDSDYGAGGDFCCPPRMSCEEDDDGYFRCQTITTACDTYLTLEACGEEEACTWLSLLEGGKCVGDLTNYDCGYYNNESVCGTDEFNFGKIGIGTDLAGTYMSCEDDTYLIPEDMFQCQWYEEEVILDKKCRITYSAVQAGYSELGKQKVFSCSNVYELGECIDGKQSVDWFSDNTPGYGFDNGVPEECLEAFGCNDGASVRFCGEPTIKLPGFSLFALFISLFIIGMYYSKGIKN